jgi:hypothetical protein
LFEDDDTEAKETKPVPKAQAKPKPKAAGGTRLTGRKKRKIVAFPTDKWEIICSKYSESELLIAIEKWLDELGDDSAKYRVDFVPRGRLAKDIDFKEIKICIKSPTYKKLKETGNISGAIRALVYQNVGIPITKVLECAK